LNHFGKGFIARMVAAFLVAVILWPLPRAQAETAAKPTPPPSDPVPDEPVATEAIFGEWMMRCRRVGEAGKTARACEVAQIMKLQGQNTVLAQVAIGGLTAGGPLRLTALLPSNILLPSSVHIATDEAGDPGVELAWRRCLPGGCIAETNADEDLIKRWRGRSGGGKLSYKNARGQTVVISFSFRGFAQALLALAKETP
jgi:invasion protein IalB